MGDWLPVEQSLSKDIKKIYTKSIMWTVILTIITILAFIIILVVLQRALIPANYAENTAIEASTEMKNNTSMYLDEQVFFLEWRNDFWPQKIRPSFRKEFNARNSQYSYK